MATEDFDDVRKRQLGAFAKVDETDASDFIERLDEMRALKAFQAYKRKTFELLGLSAGEAAADVGCGTGEDARALAEITGSSGEVIGFDLSEAMIAESKRRHSDVRGLKFVGAPSDRLGLPSDCLDGIRADRVLIHVPDPSATLDEMVRVVRPGGRIVLSEPDMPGLWLANDDYATTNLIIQEIARTCVTPFLARDLWAMCRDQGLTDMSFLTWTITAFDLSAAAKVLDFNAILKLMVHRALLEEEQAKAWINGVTTRASEGRFVAGLNILTVSATKP